MTLYTVPTRFDTEEPFDHEFVKQGETLFLGPGSAARLVATFLDDPDAELLVIHTRVLQSFVKRLSAHSRLRVKFPQYQRSVVLDFPLAGASEALIPLAQECGVPAAEGTALFLDADGAPYATLTQMLQDDTWLARTAQSSKDQ